MWRVRSYSHTDENGIKHYASFTAPTKAQAEQRAAAFNHKKRLRRRNDYTCGEAIQIYIDKLPADISPATLRGYNAIQKRILSHEIAFIRINHLSDDELQDFIKEMELEGFSAKTIQSTYSFLMSSIKKYCDQRFDVKLPKIHRPPKNAPSDADVQFIWPLLDLSDAERLQRLNIRTSTKEKIQSLYILILCFLLLRNGSTRTTRRPTHLIGPWSSPKRSSNLWVMDNPKTM